MLHMGGFAALFPNFKSERCCLGLYVDVRCLGKNGGKSSREASKRYDLILAQARSKLKKSTDVLQRKTSSNPLGFSNALGVPTALLHATAKQQLDALRWCSVTNRKTRRNELNVTLSHWRIQAYWSPPSTEEE